MFPFTAVSSPSFTGCHKTEMHCHHKANFAQATQEVKLRMQTTWHFAQLTALEKLECCSNSIWHWWTMTPHSSVSVTTGKINIRNTVTWCWTFLCWTHRLMCSSMQHYCTNGQGLVQAKYSLQELHRQKRNKANTLFTVSHTMQHTSHCMA